MVSPEGNDNDDDIIIPLRRRSSMAPIQRPILFPPFVDSGDL